MIVFNIHAAAILGIAASITSILSAVVNWRTPEQYLILAAPMAIVMDLLYRMKWGEKQWLHPNKGADLF
jgi:hypothetical protein